MMKAKGIRDRMNMDFLELQESLRRIMADRIRQHEFTGASLAKETGFQQAHISNFLHRKRGLSLQTMDCILKVLHLSVADLLDPAEIETRAHVALPSEEYENIPLVNPAAGHRRLVPHSAVLEHVTFKKNFLHRLRPDMASPREEWPRFVCIKVDAENGNAMAPCISPGAILLIDRHYNSLQPYRRKCSNLYAVRSDRHVLIRYIEPQEETLLLRPESQQFPLTIIGTGSDDSSAADQIIGRVCHVSREL
jgi:transcriptional regulator with XRE-family HTH domain